jgi:alpha-L-rhamnosidase
MGLLNQKDWQGKWIGWDRGENADPFNGSKWIWFPEGNPATSAPAGMRYFRRVFELPANQAVRAATIAMRADNEFHLFVNGQEAGKGDNWRTPGSFAIGALLKPGKNVLAVEARNVGDAPTPAGLIGRLKVIFEQGNPLKLDTDDNWKSATNSAEGWNTAAFDDTTWAMAKSRSEMMEYRPGELSVTKTGGCQPFT